MDHVERRVEGWIVGDRRVFLGLAPGLGLEGQLLVLLLTLLLNGDNARHLPS